MVRGPSDTMTMSTWVIFQTVGDNVASLLKSKQKPRNSPCSGFVTNCSVQLPRRRAVLPEQESPDEYPSETGTPRSKIR